jgi:hypothetical protein
MGFHMVILSLEVVGFKSRGGWFREQRWLVSKAEVVGLKSGGHKQSLAAVGSGTGVGIHSVLREWRCWGSRAEVLGFESRGGWFQERRWLVSRVEVVVFESGGGGV